MKIIKIEAFENGGHDNQTYNGVLPFGWAMDVNNLCVENFPFGKVEAEEIEGVVTVTKWVSGVVPKATTEEQIAELKASLESTDYQAIKYAEGWLSEEEYAPIKAQRQAWRDEINALEG